MLHLCYNYLNCVKLVSEGKKEVNMPKVDHCVRCGDRDLASDWCWTCEGDYADYVKAGGTLSPEDWD